MATYQTGPKVKTGNDNDKEDNSRVLQDFVYKDKSIDDLAKERNESWEATYHTLLEKLDKASNDKK